MKGMVLVVCFMTLSFPVSAGPLHFKKPHPIGFVKHHKLLLVTSALFLASDFADTEETIQAQRRCPTCAETSDLFGKHPLPARLWGESAAFDVGYVALAWYGTSETSWMGTKDWTPEEKAENPKLYKLCWLERPGTVVLFMWFDEAHARAAYDNAGVPRSASTLTLGGVTSHTLGRPVGLVPNNPWATWSPVLSPSQR